MTTTVALFVGGPWDGRLEVLRDSQDAVAVAEYDSTPISAWGKEEPISDVVRVRRSYYRPEKTALFGRSLKVWVHEDLAPWERPQALARHLLSPVALGLTGGAE